MLSWLNCGNDWPFTDTHVFRSIKNDLKKSDKETPKEQSCKIFHLNLSGTAYGEDLWSFALNLYIAKMLRQLPAMFFDQSQ